MNKYFKLALLAGAAAATGGAALAVPGAAGAAGAAGAGAAGGGLLGGAAGAGGAAGGAGLLGGATATAIPTATAFGSPLASAAAGGGLAPSGFAGYMAQAKPFMDAASTGMQVAGSMNQPSPMAAPPQLPQQMGAQTLQTLAQKPQYDAGQDAEMRRKRRMGLLGAYA